DRSFLRKSVEWQPVAPQRVTDPQLCSRSGSQFLERNLAFENRLHTDRNGPIRAAFLAVSVSAERPALNFARRDVDFKSPGTRARFLLRRFHSHGQLSVAFGPSRSLSGKVKTAVQAVVICADISGSQNRWRAVHGGRVIVGHMDRGPQPVKIPDVLTID